MIKKLLVLAAFVFSAMSLVVTPVKADPPVDQDKITICHRTNSDTNPYNSIEVDQNAADGVAGNSQGNQPDHFGEHTGPVWELGLKAQKIDWGDIIPPIDGVHEGLNWTEEGRAIYKNDCVPTFVEDTVIVFDVVCAEVREETVVQVTFTNFGDTAGSVELNGETIEVEGGATVIRYVDLDTEVVIEIDEEQVYKDTPECEEPEEEGEVLAEEDTPEGAVDAGMGSVALLGLIASGAVLAGGITLARKQTN